MAGYKIGGVKLVTIAAVALVCTVIGCVVCDASVLKKLSNCVNGSELSKMSTELKSDKTTAEQVHELLKGFGDKQAQIGSYTVEQLLALNEVSLDQCKMAVLSELSDKINQYDSHWDSKRNGPHAKYKGLLNYLKRCQIKLAKLCLDNYIEVEQQALANLDDEDKDNIERFMSGVADRSSINEEVVEKAEGIYLDSHKHRLGGKDGHDMLSLLKYRLEQSCKTVLDIIKLKSALESYADYKIRLLDIGSRLPEWQGVEEACEIYGASSLYETERQVRKDSYYKFE